MTGFALPSKHGLHRSALHIALSIAASTLGARAHAQTAAQAAVAPSLANSLTGQAKSDYEAGRILFSDQDYAGAFVKFQQAFSIAGDVRLLWNMAVCEKNLRHYANVLSLLERYQRERVANMSETHRREVDGVIRTVQTLISTVHVAVNEDGASIFVDDHLVGTTPLSGPLLIDLGRRRLRISKQGFIEQALVQDFGGGSTMTLRFSLAPKTEAAARLTISAEGSISIDGKPVAERYFAGPVPPGEHALRITAPGMLPYEREVALQAGQARTLNISLTPQKRGGVPTLVWVGAGVVAASGLAVGGYFLFREKPHEPNYPIGTLSPGTIQL